MEATDYRAHDRPPDPFVIPAGICTACGGTGAEPLAGHNAGSRCLRCGGSGSAWRTLPAGGRPCMDCDGEVEPHRPIGARRCETCVERRRRILHPRRTPARRRCEDCGAAVTPRAKLCKSCALARRKKRLQERNRRKRTARRG